MKKWLLCCIFLSLSQTLAADNLWYYKDSFSDKDKIKLQHWISDTKEGVEELVAPFPFSTHFVFYKRHLQREPVPWANTQREKVQGVHFYVDSRYALKRFSQDWTASHEIAHLLIPWIGHRQKWFAEGFASYMQYPVMYINGDISWGEAIERLEDNLSMASSHNSTRKQSIAKVSRRMHSAKANKVVYWGGALYFMTVDKQLWEQKQLRLFDVLAKYQHCCRRDADWGKSGFVKLIQELDRLSDSSIFSQNLPRFLKQPGFPEYQDALAWLAQHPPKSERIAIAP